MKQLSDYDLHDSEITKIEFENNCLTLYLRNFICQTKNQNLCIRIKVDNYNISFYRISRQSQLPYQNIEKKIVIFKGMDKLSLHYLQIVSTQRFYYFK